MIGIDLIEPSLPGLAKDVNLRRNMYVGGLHRLVPGGPPRFRQIDVTEFEKRGKGIP